MNILIAGGTGLVGSSLIPMLQTNHQITLLGRNKNKIMQLYPELDAFEWDSLEQYNPHEFDVILNLCGENISSQRWTPATKQTILDSRVKTTEKLLTWIEKYKATPHFYSTSAVGIYGAYQENDEIFTEEKANLSDKPKDFLSDIGIQWEKATDLASKHNIPLTIVRFGVVLKPNDGFLAKLAPSFQWGMGAIIGKGTQYISWIHHEDLANALVFLIEHPDLTGVFNLCSPKAVTQKTFAKTFAHVLHRPLILRLPYWFTKMMFGQMGDELINKGQRVYPKKLIEKGFVFKYPELEDALRVCYEK